MLIRKKSGEVIDVESEEILDARDFAALIGREDDPVVTALVAEIRRLGTVLANAQPNPAPVVNVTPSFNPPAVTFSPRVDVDSPREWFVDVQHHMGGPLHGKIKSCKFIATQT